MLSLPKDKAPPRPATPRPQQVIRPPSRPARPGPAHPIPSIPTRLPSRAFLPFLLRLHNFASPLNENGTSARPRLAPPRPGRFVLLRIIPQGAKGKGGPPGRASPHQSHEDVGPAFPPRSAWFRPARSCGAVTTCRIGGPATPRPAPSSNAFRPSINSPGFSQNYVIIMSFPM